MRNVVEARRREIGEEGRIVEVLDEEKDATDESGANVMELPAGGDSYVPAGDVGGNNASPSTLGGNP